MWPFWLHSRLPLWQHHVGFGPARPSVVALYCTSSTCLRLRSLNAPGEALGAYVT
jgi:hypothetical protein